MLLLCYSMLKSKNISINNSEKKLVPRKPPAQLKKLQRLRRKRSNNWPMEGFADDESEIITWMGRASQPKIQN